MSAMFQNGLASLKRYAEDTQPLFVEVEVATFDVPEDASACIADYFKALAKQDAMSSDDSVHLEDAPPEEHLERAHFHCHKILAVHYYEAAEKMMAMFAGDDLAHVGNAGFLEERALLRLRAAQGVEKFTRSEDAIRSRLISEDSALYGDGDAQEREASKDASLREEAEESYRLSKDYYDYVRSSIPGLNYNHFQRDRFEVLHTWQGKAGSVTLILGVVGILHAVVASLL